MAEMQRGAALRKAVAAAAVILGAIAVVALVATPDGRGFDQAYPGSIVLTSKTMLQEDSTAETGSEEPKATLRDLYREVQELQKQENAHFSAREKALQNALSKATEDTDMKNLKWKSAEDRYEQAALNDIHDQDNSRSNITGEGDKQFEEYEEKAQELMGTRDIKKLVNQTALKERTRQSLQQKALSTLRSTEHELHQIEQEERRLADAKEEKKQVSATRKEASHLSQIALAHAAHNDEYTQAKSESDAEMGERPYRSDYKAAAAIETKRADAFRKEVAEERRKVEAERAHREQLLKAHPQGEGALGKEGEASGEEVMEEAQSKRTETMRQQADEQVKALSEKVGVVHSLKSPVPGVVDLPAEEFSADKYEREEREARRVAEEASHEEEQQQASFLQQRAGRLAADSSKSAALSKQLEATSDQLLEPSQVADAAPAHEEEEGEEEQAASSLITGRATEVADIMDRGNVKAP